ncbi:MAG: chromosome partitioning protein, partial [Alphaproteobacteria bacterium]
MPRILLVAQETGGIGKSTVTRGLAEAVPDAAILEI